VLGGASRLRTHEGHLGRAADTVARDPRDLGASGSEVGAHAAAPAAQRAKITARIFLVSALGPGVRGVRALYLKKRDMPGTRVSILGGAVLAFEGAAAFSGAPLPGVRCAPHTTRRLHASPSHPPSVAERHPVND